jgi:Rad3-related DNA helicase
VEHITAIASNINLTPRADQFVTMYLLLNSGKHLTLIELATGTGKSVMLALMA